MSLLDDLKGVGERLLEAELPAGKDVVAILGALVAHLETKGEQLATVELDKLAGKLAPVEPVPGAPPAAEPAVPEPAVAAVDPTAHTRAELDEQAKAAGVEAPEQLSTKADVAAAIDTEAQGGPSKAQLEAELAQARAQAASTAPIVAGNQNPPPA